MNSQNKINNSINFSHFNKQQILQNILSLCFKFKSQLNQFKYHVFFSLNKAISNIEHSQFWTVIDMLVQKTIAEITQRKRETIEK